MSDETPRKDAIQALLFEINENGCARADTTYVVKLLGDCDFPNQPPIQTAISPSARQVDELSIANAGKCITHAEVIARFSGAQLLQYCEAGNLAALLQRILEAFDEPEGGGPFVPRP